MENLECLQTEEAGRSCAWLDSKIKGKEEKKINATV